MSPRRRSRGRRIAVAAGMLGMLGMGWWGWPPLALATGSAAAAEGVAEPRSTLSTSAPPPLLLAAPVAAGPREPLALSCLGCHQPGLGPDARAVDLATLEPGELVAALRAYRDGSRAGTVMPRLARGLDDAEIDGLGRQFGATGGAP